VTADREILAEPRRRLALRREARVAALFTGGAQARRSSLHALASGLEYEQSRRGGVAERLKAPVLKTGIP
jgi:hypothetical protein